MSKTDSLPDITLIAGPTASGKSRLALDMALATDGIIINADSQQLYADLDVLSARPPREDEAQAPHRLYGVVDAAEAWSVGKWSEAALAEIADAKAQGRHAIVVGGTGLYFNALVKGLAEIPEVPLETRDAVQAEYETIGEAAFRAILREVDPTAEAAIFPSDRQRLVRALSVHRASGRSLTEWKADTRPLLSPDQWRGIIVEPDRQALYDNCDRRVDIMIDTGAVEEVRALMARNLDSGLPAMKAVGVREIAAWLAGEMDRDTAITAMKQATRNYAKRQLTWFRNQQAEWPRHRP
ncbi:tRNA (adenosine(37)-N6)-dimethylallyltransferase MiaA [uncultured Brevundimonas sp.]|uniref:tRNA (adenosine(37)-N6)-dimethylallyltransferase MiaA n=1 Tax=uncultured Brevundimonas sp. TaxID=213418 RepID=UPI00261AD93F|nr:tRNA (adenosine(37)-N6)-dimethylallyltransferase MiaA [uncultured Brevundimonas sp.]